MASVSIIVTSYNHQDFIAQAIQSIFSQTYTDREILIGDDSPNNVTWDIIQDYIKIYPSKIRTRHHSPSKHIVGNLNFLLSHIDKSSKYVAFLEGDDLWDPNYLLEKIEIFENYPEVGLVYNDLSIVDAKGHIVEENRIASRTKKWYRNETDSVGRLLSGDMTCFSYSTLMSRNFTRIKIHNRGNKELLGSESDYRLQIARRCNIYGIKKPLTLYRKHSDNSSKDLNVTIEHFTFLVGNYFSDGLINEKEYDKARILIYLMRLFSQLKSKRIAASIASLYGCLKISLLDTLVMGCDSLYYRLVKPGFLNLTKRLGRK